VISSIKRYAKKNLKTHAAIVHEANSNYLKDLDDNIFEIVQNAIIAKEEKEMEVGPKAEEKVLKEIAKDG